MASMWRRAMLYLGLGPDEEYDEYYDDVDLGATAYAPDVAAPERPGAPRATGPVRAPNGPAGPGAPQAPAQPTSSLGPVAPADDQRESAIGAIRPVRDAADAGAPDDGPGSAVVRPIQPRATAKPHVVMIGSFNDAQEVADRFKSSQPVIVNLTAVERELSRRLIDFASGLCYGIGGHMEKIANQVYLLTPNDIEVSDEDKRRLQERGFSAV